MGRKFISHPSIINLPRYFSVFQPWPTSFALATHSQTMCRKMEDTCKLIFLVGWFWVKRPFETVFQSISGRLPQRGRKRKERIDESKNVQTTPTRTYCKRSRPLPYCNPNCRTPGHWKFTQDHRTTRPPPMQIEVER